LIQLSRHFLLWVRIFIIPISV